MAVHMSSINKFALFDHLRIELTLIYIKYIDISDKYSLKTLSKSINTIMNSSKSGIVVDHVPNIKKIALFRSFEAKVDVN